MRLAVVVLAGGEGRRIGGGKPDRLLAGRRLIDHALALARGWSDTVAVAVRAPLELPEEVPQLIDEEGNGPIAGIASALRFAEQGDFDAVLTLPTDTPLLPDNLLARLAAANAPAAIPISGGQLHPASALWAVPTILALPAYLASGRGSLMGFAERVGFDTVEWPIEPFDPFFNVNTPEDLAEAEALLRSR